MANPQKENGHVDIANEIIEALAKIRISGEEMQCLWVILRKTYGWHKKEDSISLSQFMELTDMRKPNICRSLKKLLSKLIISVIKSDNGITTYRFNKNYDLWGPLSKMITLSKVITPVIKSDNKSLSILRHTKENYTKETITKERYGEFKNVLLSEEEYKKLTQNFGEIKAKAMIENISAYLASKGDKYKSHYATMLNWERKNPLATNQDDPYSNLEIVGAKNGNSN